MTYPPDIPETVLTPQPGPTPTAIRLRGAAVAIASLSALLLAASLTPRPGGFGTHEQLGFPACSFLVRHRLPCPTCGVTTSVSAAAQGRFGEALKSQPFGVILFAAAAFLSAGGAAEAIGGRGILRAFRPKVWWIPAAVAGMLLGWGWKLLSGFYTGELPLK